MTSGCKVKEIRKLNLFKTQLTQPRILNKAKLTFSWFYQVPQ